MPSKPLTIQNRVYLERVKLFFGNAVGNLISAVIGGIFISLILKSVDVPVHQILIWFSFVCLFAMTTGYIEKRYSNQVLNIQNASKWVYVRSVAGALIALMYGLSPFIFSQYLGVQEEMFLFIAFSAMVSIALVGYSIMPYYYTLLNLLSLTPLTFYFLSYSDFIHIILAMTAIVWQFLVISKGWKVSKSSINAITLNEQLQDEIQHHKETKEKLLQLATHDILTGIPNRRLLMENLESMFSLALRHDKKVIIMFIDLDGFKNVNDSHGHEAGDFLLKEVSVRLKHYIRKSDTLARMGGDEFILGFMESEDIETLTDRIINSIAEPITLPNGNIAQVGASIGVSLFPDDGDTPEDLIRVADNRMYTSKSNTKGMYTFSD